MSVSGTSWNCIQQSGNAGSVNIGLTGIIEPLTDTVYRQANNLRELKEGMKIESAHVKRANLH